MSDEDVALKYKKAIKKQIFPDSGFSKLNLAQAKKELSQFKKYQLNLKAS